MTPRGWRTDAWVYLPRARQRGRFPTATVAGPGPCAERSIIGSAGAGPERRPRTRAQTHDAERHQTPVGGPERKSRRSRPVDWDDVSVKARPDELAVDGLLLRRLTKEDAALMQTAIRASREHLVHFMPFASADPDHLELRRQWIDHVAERFDQGSSFNYGIVKNGVVVGGCSIDPKAHGAAAIGTGSTSTTPDAATRAQSREHSETRSRRRLFAGAVAP